jgi:periplasmic divalent cation tolerance protein
MSYKIIITTTTNKKEAVKIVRILLKERLIACGNIIGSMYSLYWWKGKIQEDNEVMIIMKSNEKLLEKTMKKILEIHSYKIPEILVLPIEKGSQPYLNWMEECLNPRKNNE